MDSIVQLSFFSERIRYVRYMLSASVCRLSVTLVRPIQPAEVFGNFFHHTIDQGLYFSGAKYRWWGRPFPLKFAFKVTHPFSNSEILTNIGS